MKRTMYVALSGLLVGLLAVNGMQPWSSSLAQQTTGAATQTPGPLSAEEMEILVARIALYPDELIALIVAASLYPIQIVQAQRYLDEVKSQPSNKPDSTWDGSVISLLNYPVVVKMMSDDLDWTQDLAAAVTNQEKDLLEAIQQLRDRAAAKGVLKSDEKTVVVHQQDKIIIQPASANEVYVPVYEPKMLYEPQYVTAPVSYYPQPYPSYYYPSAPYFAGFFTGAIWGAAIDWNDWGVWGGNGRWGDVDIDCNNCFNDRNFNGKMNWNDVDWSNVDRSKISFDKSNFSNFDKTKIKDGLKANDSNNLRNRASDLNRNRPSTLPGKGNRQVKDVRKSTLEGLKKADRARASNQPAKRGDRAGRSGQNAAGSNRSPGISDRMNRPSGSQNRALGGQNRPGKANPNRPAAKAKPASRPDARRRNPSPMGDITRGRDARSFSNRGARSMGGGMYGGGGGRGGANMYRPRGSFGGGGGGGRGGGGRGGGGRGR